LPLSFYILPRIRRLSIHRVKIARLNGVEGSS
jgi:hypothetical protein